VSAILKLLPALVLASVTAWLMPNLWLALMAGALSFFLVSFRQRRAGY
jgi:hypothetical protein